MTREEAIKKIKEEMPTLWKETKEAIQVLIPELAESEDEDEKTRKELLEEIESIIPHEDETDSEGLILPSYHTRIDRYKSYLEKQKDLDKMIVVSPEVWDTAIADAYENGKKDEEKQKEQKPKMTPKWLYRLEFKDSSCGLWYDGSGKWCFESGIGSIGGCKTKTLPMDYDARYKQDGRDWFSSCSRKEDLMHWYSLEDAKELISKGFIFTRYLATEYHEYDQQTVFIKESALCREEIDIFELSEQQKSALSEEDEIMIGSLINYFEGDALDCSLDSVVNWLKSLRPQPKQNDVITPNKEFFQWIYDRLVNVHNEDPNVDYMISFKKRIEELSFNEPSWKPSEEQIKAVEHAYNSFPNECPTKSNLRRLSFDLKKLR
jgi:hypothetical protein